MNTCDLMWSAGCDVVELFSPPRVGPVAEARGLRQGVAMDKLTEVKDGGPWDFDKPEDRRRGQEVIRELRPRLLIGSPPCTWFSVMQNMNCGKMDPEEVRIGTEQGRVYLRYAVDRYWEQMEAGRYFLHEHPAGAWSWSEPYVQVLVNDPRVQVAVAHQCRYGLTAQDDDGKIGAVMKLTRFMTNCPWLVSALGLRCTCKHKHVQLMGGGRAAEAAVYPPGLCQAICSGLIEKNRED